MELARRRMVGKPPAGFLHRIAGFNSIDRRHVLGEIRLCRPCAKRPLSQVEAQHQDPTPYDEPCRSAMARSEKLRARERRMIAERLKQPPVSVWSASSELDASPRASSC